MYYCTQRQGIVRYQFLAISDNPIYAVDIKRCRTMNRYQNKADTTNHEYRFVYPSRKKKKNVLQNIDVFFMFRFFFFCSIVTFKIVLLKWWKKYQSISEIRKKRSSKTLFDVTYPTPTPQKKIVYASLSTGMNAYID